MSFSISEVPLNEKVCPVCGAARHWAWTLVHHNLDDARIVHVKIATQGANRMQTLCALLVNGKCV